MNVKLKEKMRKIGQVAPELISYNIEMTEVTGGTFWKSYTPEQVAGTEKYDAGEVFSGSGSLMEYFPPIDLYEKNIRKYGKGLGKAWIRVSGSWASHTFYDFDGECHGNAPEGYHSALTRKEWTGVLDFVEAVGGKLLISFSNCPGDHVGGKVWTPEQAKMIMDFSAYYGVPVSAVEFMNEPNLLPTDREMDGYTIDDYARDQDICYRFIRENYPDVLIVGPCAASDPYNDKMKAVAEIMPGGTFPTHEILARTKEKPDVFSYHCYTGVSERGAMMGGHWDVSDATHEEYFAVPGDAAKFYKEMKEKLIPGAPMWVTETAAAACGGNTWDSTYLEVPRLADELGRFSTISDGVLFRNTLASSDYGLLDHKTHLPRPSYWLCYIWNKLVGTEVYDTEEEIREGAHVYAHSRRDGKPGSVYIIVNTSEAESTTVELPCEGEMYLLGAPEKRACEIALNGKILQEEKSGALPEIDGMKVTGTAQIPPLGVAFIVL